MTHALSKVGPDLTEWESGDIRTCWSQSAWLAQMRVSESRVAMAQSWEMHALEAQARVAIQQKTHVMQEGAVTALRQEFSQKMPEVNEEDRAVFPARPLGSSKAEYFLGLTAYLVMLTRIWCFVSQWLHKGGCKSGDQDMWPQKGKPE